MVHLLFNQSSERVRESSGEPIDETVVSAGVKRRWLS